MTQGQGLTISPAPVSAQGFRQISHPIIMMFARPVVGVYDGWLFLSTSADAVNKCLAVSAKHAPSITSNLRFKREGLIPSGPVLACSFKDTSNYGREKAATISMVGMVASMATMSMPNDLDLQSMKQSVQMLTKLLHKLGPVFQKIDFLSSQSAMTVYDGELTVTTKTLVTYKEPDQKRRVKTVQRKSGW